jgi:hypothetical protein
MALVKDCIGGTCMFKKLILAMQIPEMISAGDGKQKAKGWMYELVANGRNGLDVDKFDYLQVGCMLMRARSLAPFYSLPFLWHNHWLSDQAKIARPDGCSFLPFVQLK